MVTFCSYLFHPKPQQITFCSDLFPPKPQQITFSSYLFPPKPQQITFCSYLFPFVVTFSQPMTFVRKRWFSLGKADFSPKKGDFLWTKTCSFEKSPFPRENHLFCFVVTFSQPMTFVRKRWFSLGKGHFSEEKGDFLWRKRAFWKITFSYPVTFVGKRWFEKVICCGFGGKR